MRAADSTRSTRPALAERLGRMLCFPFTVVRRGGIGYIAIVVTTFLMLLWLAHTLEAIIGARIEELVKSGQIPAEGRNSSLGFVPILFGFITTAVLSSVVGVAARPAFLGEPMRLAALMKSLPQAVSCACGSLGAALWRGFLCFIPIFAVGVLLQIGLIYFSPSNRALTAVLTAASVILLPIFWGFFLAALTPLIAVCGDLPGKEAARLGPSIFRRRELNVLGMLLLGASLAFGIPAALKLFEAALSPRAIFIGGATMLWYLTTAVAHECLEGLAALGRLKK